MAAMTAQRRDKLNDRLGWLDRSLAELRRDYARAPRLVALSVVALPVAWFAGWMLASLVVFIAVTLACVQRYVAWIHINECEVEQRFIREELGAVARDLST